MLTTRLVLGLSLLALPVLTQVGDLNRTCTWCAQNAGCDGDGNTCECSGNFVGRGDFLCYRPDRSDVCTLCDDPVHVGFGGVPAVKLDFLDTFLFSDDIFERGNTRYQITTFISGERVKGKVFPRCILVLINVYTKQGNNWNLDCTYVFKVTGIWDSASESVQFDIVEHTIAFSTTFTFPEGNRIALLSSETGATKTKTVNGICGCNIKFQIEKGNIFVAEFLNCIDWDLGFRPFIKDYPWVKSGVYIKAQKRDPTTTLPDASTTLPMCLAPGLHLDMLRDRLGLNQTSDAACWLAAVNIHPAFSNQWPLTRNLSIALNDCSDTGLARFFNMARSFLNLPPVVNCLSNSGSSVSQFLNAIVNLITALCQANVDSCRNVREVLNNECVNLLAARQNDPTYAQIIALATDYCDRLP